MDTDETHAQTSSHRKRSLLIIGHARDVIDEIVPLLRRDGFEVSGFLRIDEALSALARNGYDLVLIGADMGAEEKELIVAESIRSHPEQRVYELTTELGEVVNRVRAALAA